MDMRWHAHCPIGKDSRIWTGKPMKASSTGSSASKSKASLSRWTSPTMTKSITPLVEFGLKGSARLKSSYVCVPRNSSHRASLRSAPTAHLFSPATAAAAPLGWKASVGQTSACFSRQDSPAREPMAMRMRFQGSARSLATSSVSLSSRSSSPGTSSRPAGSESAAESDRIDAPRSCGGSTEDTLICSAFVTWASAGRASASRGGAEDAGPSSIVGDPQSNSECHA
mmetsp:Transcript_114312/g.207915  ORF Transcript_114312/g.207915 Transcript_114312/m.207915 type:complete len:226 (-) Transcript_114312:21-698(-)